MTAVEEFGSVFPGVDADKLKELAATYSIELNADLQPNTTVSVGQLEKVLVQVQSGSPNAALLAFCLGLRLYEKNAPYARILCESAYAFQLVSQASGKPRIHKGQTLHQLGLVYVSLGDPGGAFRWFVLAHLEDCISHSDAEKRKAGKAFEVLRARYGVRSEQFEKLWKAVDAIRESKNKTEREEFAELYPDVLYLLTWIDAGIFAPLSRTTTEIVNWPLLEALLAKLANTNDSDGKLAELWLAVYFFGAAAFEIRTNVWMTTKEYEFDVLVASGLDHAHLTSTLGNYFAAESKDWDHKVGTPAVNHFASKLMFHGMTLGILLAKANLSGSAGEAAGKGYSYGRKTLLKLVHSQGVYVVVWDLKDLTQLVEQRRGPISALRAAYEEARFELSGRQAGA